MTTVTAPSRHIPSPGLREARRAEWTKLKSVRSTWLLGAIAAAVGIGLSLVFTLVTSTKLHTMSPADRAKFDAVASSRVGIDLSVIVFIVFGALAAASEFSSGMIRLTLTVTPNRLRVIAAKAIAVALPAYVMGVVLGAAAFFGGQAIIRSADSSMAVGLGNKGVLSSLLNTGSEMVGYSLIALALALLLRSAAGAIATSMGIIFAPLLIGQLMPTWVSKYILTYLPASAADNMTSVHRGAPSSTYLDPQTAGLVLAAWVLAFLGLAYLSLTRRDVG